MEQSHPEYQRLHRAVRKTISPTAHAIGALAFIVANLGAPCSAQLALTGTCP